MPNRILKESICTSPTIDKLNPAEEAFFYRIIVNCDDYGRMEATPKIIRSRCYPLRIDTTTDDDIIKWLGALGQASLLKVYSVDGRQFIQVSTWEKHQQIRARRSKYPDPSNNGATPQPSDSICNQLQSNANSSNHQQVKSIDSKCPRNPIQSNPIQSESESNKPLRVNDEVWTAYLEMRKKKKAYPTEYAKSLICKKLAVLEKSGDNPNDVLNQSIINNWVGIFPLRKEVQNGKSGTNQTGYNQKQSSVSSRPIPHAEDYTEL